MYSICGSAGVLQAKVRYRLLARPVTSCALLRTHLEVPGGDGVPADGHKHVLVLQEQEV
jgi:hypothetical protein